MHAPVFFRFILTGYVFGSDRREGNKYSQIYFDKAL